MKPLHADISRYEIAFTGPITVRGLRVERREGLVFALKTSPEGVTAYGEVAPLPGLHEESLAEAEGALSDFIPELAGLRDNTRHERRELLEGSGLPPSVITGVEMALLNLEAIGTGRGPSFPGAYTAAHTVPVNALLFGTPESVMDRAEYCYAQGFRTFKLKVQSGRVDEAVETICRFHKAFGGRTELRLDANQSLELDDAIQFGRSIPTDSVSYIEEPLMDAALIPEFHDRTGIRSALDESLWQQPDLLERFPANCLGALILKPNRIGGIQRSLDLAAIALGKNLLPVFSSAFESGISLGFYAWLAAVSAPEPAACGLDTGSFLSHDLLEVPFSAQAGTVDPAESWSNSFAVRHDMLIPIATWTL